MKYIDQDELYKATNNGLSIFEHYYPGEPLTKHGHFFKIRDKEKTASAQVTWYQGLWRITDFGNQGEVKSLPAVNFVMWYEGLPYYEALKYIESVIVRREIGSGDFKPAKYSPDYKFREMTPGDKKGQYNFTYKEKPTKKDLEAIGRYVTAEILEQYKCRPVEQYEYCGNSKTLNRDVVHIFIATDDYPMFVFDYGDFKKLYRPHDQEKKNRFIYVGDKPKDYVYGLDLIEDADNEFVDEQSGEDKPPVEKPNAKVKDLFRCSGESDAINLASIGFHVYWLNSESAEYAEGQFSHINSLCENHYQIMDLDETGKSEAIKKALKYMELHTVVLPKWLTYKKDFRGNPCKDLKDYINLCGRDQDDTFFSFLVLKRRAKQCKFWHKVEDKKGGINYNINLEYYYWFMQCSGFYSMDSNYHKRATYCYVKIDGKIVELIHPDNMKKIAKRFTKDWIRSKNLMDEIAILNKINSSNQISEANLQELEEISLNFYNHDQHTEILNFRNGSLKITRDKIEKVKHTDLPNYILGRLEVDRTNIVSHIIDKNIRLIEKPAIEVNATPKYKELLDRLASAKNDNERDIVNVELTKFSELDRYEVTINDNDFYFINFLRDLSRLHWRKELEQGLELSDHERKEENLTLANILFVLGYNCARYKDPAKPWLTFMQDMKISSVGQSSGRSGKSILTQAVTNTVSSFYIGGRKLNDKQQYQFLYDGYTEFHQFIEVDDFHEFGDFDFFYTQITGKREVNPKNLSPFTLDYANSGKMLMSSNFELHNTHSSTFARLLNCGVSDYYHESTKYNDYKETRSPFTKYGRNVFMDFTEEEWTKFYNIMAYCIQLQMRFYKIQPPMGNLEKRQMRKEMAKGLGRDEEFLEWADSFFSVCPNNVDKPDFSPDDIGYYNTLINKQKAYEQFCLRLTTDQARKYKITQFKKHVFAYCEYYEFEFNPADMCTTPNETDPGKRRILKTRDGRTEEYFYINTRNMKSMPSADEPAAEQPEDELPF